MIDEFGYINFTEPREDGIEHLILVLNNDKKPGIITKELDTTAERGLCIDRQKVRIHENNRFENNTIIGLDIRFGEKFEILADKFNTFPMGAVDEHDIGFYLGLIPLINLFDKPINNSPLAGPRGSME